MEGRTGLPRIAADNGAEQILICGQIKIRPLISRYQFKKFISMVSKKDFIQKNINKKMRKGGVSVYIFYTNTNMKIENTVKI